VNQSGGRGDQAGRPQAAVEDGMEDCIFCKIVAGEIPADIVFEDDAVMAFRDLNPQAPTHVLVIPKRHIASLNDLTADDQPLMGRLFTAARDIAVQAGFADAGYRTVVNCNADGGQTVFHIHLHLLGGRAMHWPPG
jgi:histidine triad (HIT) family protein